MKADLSEIVKLRNECREQGARYRYKSPTAFWISKENEDWHCSIGIYCEYASKEFPNQPVKKCCWPIRQDKIKYAEDK